MRTARLLPTERLLELPRAVRHGIRRLARREPRWYLVADENVIARFACQADHDVFVAWIESSTIRTFLSGRISGMEVAREADGQAYAEHPGTP